VDWEWLSRQQPVNEKGCVRRLRFGDPFSVKMDGKTNQGIIYKPGKPIRAADVSGG
jgi:hypothetical protein